MAESRRASWSTPFTQLREERFSGKQRGKLVEPLGPAGLMAVARALVEELLVGQRQQRAVTVGLEQHRDQRFALGRAVPGPGEHELLVRLYLAVDAANLVPPLFGVRDHSITPADAEVGLGLHALDPLRSEPARYLRGVGPGFVDLGRRRVDAALDDEAWLGGEAGLGGHVSSSTKAARRSSCSDQKRW